MKTVASLSMIGLPPTAGFFSKYSLALAALQSGHLAFVGALVLSSLLSAIYFFRVIERAYLMGEPTGRHESRELPWPMLIPALTLAVLVVLLGVFNQAIVTAIVAPGLPS